MEENDGIYGGNWKRYSYTYNAFTLYDVRGIKPEYRVDGGEWKTINITPETFTINDEGTLFEYNITGNYGTNWNHQSTSGLTYTPTEIKTESVNITYSYFDTTATFVSPTTDNGSYQQETSILGNLLTSSSWTSPKKIVSG